MKYSLQLRRLTRLFRLMGSSACLFGATVLYAQPLVDPGSKIADPPISRIQLGVHYEYPFGGMKNRLEWMPKGEKDWKRDMAKIKETGFNSVRIRIGMDSDLDDVAKLLDVIDEQGLTTVFGFATFYVNDEFVEKYKDSKIIGGDGSVIPIDKTDVRWQRACIDHPVYREQRNKLIEDCVKRFANHPSVFVWDIHNEPSIGPLHNACFCKNSIAAYRTSIKKEFKNVADFNRKYATKFKTFESIVPPRNLSGQNRSFYYHWRSFMAENLNQFLLEGKQIVERQIPDAFITHNVTSFEALPSKGQDWWLFKDGYKLLSMSRYAPTEEKAVAGTLGYEVLKAINPDQLHWLEEFQGGPFPVPQLKVLYSGKEAEIEMNSAIGHGMKGIYFYRWDPLLNGPEPQVNGMIEPFTYDTDRRLGIKSAIESLQPHLPLIARATPLKPSVGIYLTRNQVMHAEGDSLALAGLSNLGIADFAGGAYQLLSDLGYEAACIVHGSSGLSKYQAVVFPYVTDLDDKEVADIEKYVAGGGIAIIDLPPFDPDAIERFRRVFKFENSEPEMLSYFPGFNVAGWTVRATDNTPGFAEHDFAGYSLNQRTMLKGNDVVLRFDDNKLGAAIIPSKYAGRLMISGCRFFYSYHVTLHPSTRKVIGEFLKKNIQPDIILEGVDEEFRPYVEARVLTDTTSEKAILFIINRSPHKSYKVRAKVKGYNTVDVQSPAYDVTRVLLDKSDNSN